MNIEKQKFNTVDVLYDDKKWGKRIDPDEWNANFKVLESGHNELVARLNQQVTDIDAAFESATSDGGQNITVQYGEVNKTLQEALDNVVSDIDNRYTKNEVNANINSAFTSKLEEIESAKTAAIQAKTAAEKARDEAQEIAGGDFATKSELSEHANNTDIHVTSQEKDAWNESDIFFINVRTSVVGGSVPFVVDKTYADVKSAIDTNKVLMCIFEHHYYPMSHYYFDTDSSGRITYEKFMFINPYKDTGLITLTSDASVSNNFFTVSVTDNPNSLPDTYYSEPGYVLGINDENDVDWLDISDHVSTTTLYASSWDSETSSYSFSSKYSDMTYDIEVSLDGDNATDEQIYAWIAAKMLSSSSNRIIAKGTIPTIDIPIILVVKPKTYYKGVVS